MSAASRSAAPIQGPGSDPEPALQARAALIEGRPAAVLRTNQLLSDLHLKPIRCSLQNRCPCRCTGAYRNIGSLPEGSLLEGEHFGLEQFSPLPQWGGCIFVPGSHGTTCRTSTRPTRLRRTCDLLGLLWLERETVVMEGVRFVGTTLWSDFDSIADHKGCTDLAECLRMRQKAYRAADFISPRPAARARHALAGGNRARPGAGMPRMVVCGVGTPVWGPTVARHHFAPACAAPTLRYGLAAGTAGFCNAYDDLLRYARPWLHGHLHAPSDGTAQGAHMPTVRPT